MRSRALDHLIGLCLCVGYVSLLLATESTIGMSRDEGIYVDAADAYGRFLTELWKDPSHALERGVIDRSFVVNHEHPPLMKVLFALGHLAQDAWRIFPREGVAYRFAGMLCAGLLLWLIHVFGARLYSRRAGLFAALAFALLPRPFYHAHLDAFDIPITLLITVVTYAYQRSLTERRWAVWTGLAFGVALLVKHNSWLLPIIFAIHFTWLSIVETQARRRGAARAVSRVPYWLLGVVLLGPPLFLAGWPWMWNDTLSRLNAYAAFHLHHDYYNIEYFGVNYFWPPFPISYPWVLTLFTVPFTTLVLACSGLVYEVRRALLALQKLFVESVASSELDRTQTTVLLLGSLFAPLVLISLPSTPIFGGTKHWFPAYPFLALLAGRAFDRALVLAEQVLSPRASRLLAAPLCALLLAPAAVETAHSHPFGLSHYTVAAGGVPGAARLGMNRQFWGFTTRSITPFLTQALPRGGSVYLCDTIYSAFLMLIKDGHLPANIRATGDISRADFAIVHHELHFGEVEEQIWTTYGRVQPAYVLRYDGVPIISVYENPKRKPPRSAGAEFRK